MTLLLLLRPHGTTAAPVVTYVATSVPLPALVSVARFKGST